jgi:mannose-6-phosphate isomerase-like protein (cupin superfamily)
MNFLSLLQSFFPHQISRKDFSFYVKDMWNSNKGFVTTYDDPEFLRDCIWRLSFDKLITEHGRPEQPLSISQHLFGNENSVSARLVYDPPVTHGRESLEYHTHPVDTIIIVIGGSGIYSFIRDDYIQTIDVDLSPGKILFFPANTVHTIKQIGLDGLETLNITDVLNQPSYRNEFPNEKRELLPKPSSDFSQEYNDAIEEFISYEIYLSHATR